MAAFLLQKERSSPPLRVYYRFRGRPAPHFSSGSACRRAVCCGCPSSRGGRRGAGVVLCPPSVRLGGFAFSGLSVAVARARGRALVAALCLPFGPRGALPSGVARRRGPSPAGSCRAGAASVARVFRPVASLSSRWRCGPGGPPSPTCGLFSVSALRGQRCRGRAHFGRPGGAVPRRWRVAPRIGLSPVAAAWLWRAGALRVARAMAPIACSQYR